MCALLSLPPTRRTPSTRIEFSFNMERDTEPLRELLLKRLETTYENSLSWIYLISWIFASCISSTDNLNLSGFVVRIAVLASKNLLHRINYATDFVNRSKEKKLLISLSVGVGFLITTQDLTGLPGWGLVKSIGRSKVRKGSWDQCFFESIRKFGPENHSPYSTNARVDIERVMA